MKPAGARFTTKFFGGNWYPEFSMAERIRSRDSRMVESGRPTMMKLGSPRMMSTSTSMMRASMPWMPDEIDLDNISVPSCRWCGL